MQHHIFFGSRQIDFSLTYLKRKSLGIKVNPNLSVEVLAPLDTKKELILKKIKAKAPWILKQIDHFNSYRPSTPPRRFVNGETHLYLGRQYRLKVIPDTTGVIKAWRGQLWIHAVNTTHEDLKKQLDEWYKQKAMGVFNNLLQETIPKFKKYKIASPVLSIRTMSKRWGSCSPSGKIILNPELIKASKGSIEYVIIHELCHLVHRNHDRVFFNLQNKMMPDWKKWKDRLEYSLA
ncbi:MAG: SprT family zinc-dependent metalloprotease [Chitinophagaceae bacterium]